MSLHKLKVIILLLVPLLGVHGFFVPADTWAQSTEISVGQRIAGDIGPGDRRLPSGQIYDEYNFSGQAGDKVIIDLSSKEVDTLLWLLDANRNVKVVDDDSGQGTDSVISNFSLPADGKYFIWTTTHSKGEMGAYTLTLNTVPITGLPVPITLGQTLFGSLDAADSQLSSGQYLEAYTFSATPNQSIKINMNSADLNTYLWLLNSKGKVITVGNDGQDTTDSQIIFIPKVTDDYTLWASTYNPGETGSYSLTLVATAVLESFIPINSGDLVEGALDSNLSQLNTGQLVDIYSFNGVSGQSVTISLTSADFDNYLRLFDNRGKLIKNTDADSINNLSLPTSGTYLIWASSVFAGNTGAYTLSLDLSATSSGTIAGRVTNACSGTNIGQAMVSTTPLVYFTATDADGNYTLNNLEPGTYTVSVSAESHEPALVGELAVVAAETTTADFALSPLTVGRIAVVRQSPDDGSQRLMVFKTPGVLEDDIEPEVASDLSFGDSNNQVKTVATLDIDGDCLDEIAVISEETSGNQQLLIYKPPQATDGSTQLVASDTSFGDSTTDNNIIAIAGIDTNGDGVDELVAICQIPKGPQSLLLFDVPKVMDGKANLIASVPNLGNKNGNNNFITVAGVDVNGDSIDEIATLMENMKGKNKKGIQELHIYDAPQAINSEVVLTGSYNFFGNSATDNNVIAIAGIDLNQDNIDELAVIKQNLNNEQQLFIYNTPVQIDDTVGVPLVSDPTFGNATIDDNNIAMAGISMKTE